MSYHCFLFTLNVVRKLKEKSFILLSVIDKTLKAGDADKYGPGLMPLL